jgi:serine/threonine-protein kinase RsbW
VANEAGAFELTVPRTMAGLLQVGTWVDRVTAALALGKRADYALRLCMEEAVTNLVVHAVPRRQADEDLVTLRVVAGPDGLLATVEDHCTPFDPRSVAAPARPGSIADAQVGGKGIHLMRQHARDISYVTADAANRLSLTLARE